MDIVSDLSAIEHLSRLTGEPVTVLQRWQALGLLPSEASGEPPAERRVRLIQFARQRGFEADRVAEAVREQPDLLSFIEDQLQPPTGGRRTFEQAVAEAGVDAAVASRVMEAAGLALQPGFHDDDVDSLRRMAVAMQAGMPLDALLQLVRVYADALGRVAEAENRTFHLHVHEQFRAQGLRGPALLDATHQVSEPLLELVQPTIAYFHQKAWEQASLEDMLLHLTEDVTAPTDVRGQLLCTVMFIDLVNFTPLALAMGDAVAAEVVDQFQRVVRACTDEVGGRIVKQIGDAFMIVFNKPADAVRCAVGVRDVAAHDQDFPGIHVGAHHGELLYHEGDYLGATVNLAARVAGATSANQVLVTEPVRDAAAGESHAAFVSVGMRELKGIAHQVELFELTREDGGRAAT